MEPLLAFKFVAVLLLDLDTRVFRIIFKVAMQDHPYNLLKAIFASHCLSTATLEVLMISDSENIIAI